MKIKTWSASLLALFIISGCTTSNPTQISERPVDYSPSTESYIIGNGDQLSIQVWRNPELSVDIPVRPDGVIAIPLAGELIATGKTTSQLKEEITVKLADFLKQPNVTVIVAQANSITFTQRVRITGAVANPLSIPWRQGMTVLDLVLASGSTTEFANEHKAKLYRKTPEGTIAYPIDLEGILRKGELETNYNLSPSDIISVPERFF
jgi:polysaccharide export outer membrane protein